ncbi:MAG: ATP-binding protein [Spirochaetales bacterium]|nr:MAG: ATP-binding protein [Spirochaetales bacterium]
MPEIKAAEIFNVSFPSLKDSRKGVVNGVIENIYKKGLSTKVSRDELYLIIDEAVTNAMEHGNRWDPEKMVTISVTKYASHLNISVSDEGAGFSCAPSSNTCPESESLTLRGRGIKIIRQFCKPRWNDRGNIIELIIDLR